MERRPGDQQRKNSVLSLVQSAETETDRIRRKCVAVLLLCKTCHKRGIIRSKNVHKRHATPFHKQQRVALKSTSTTKGMPFPTTNNKGWLRSLLQPQRACPFIPQTTKGGSEVYFSHKGHALPYPKQQRVALKSTSAIKGMPFHTPNNKGWLRSLLQPQRACPSIPQTTKGGSEVYFSHKGHALPYPKQQRVVPKFTSATKGMLFYTPNNKGWL